jgi:hypothetical protein
METQALPISFCIITIVRAIIQWCLCSWMIQNSPHTMPALVGACTDMDWLS